MDLRAIHKGGAFDVVETVRALAGEVADLKAGLQLASPSVTMDAGSQGADLAQPGETTLIVRDGLRGLLNDKVVAVLERAGFSTVASIAGATDEELRAVGGVGPVTLREIRELIPGK